MKLLSLTLGLVIALTPAVFLHAQDDTSGSGTPPAANDAAGGGGRFGGGKRLDFLSQADREHYLSVRKEVLKSNPDLKAEQKDLMQQMKAVNDGSAPGTDKQALFQKMMAHHQKMDAAMKAADPSVAPIVDQVNEHMKARFQKRFGNGGDAGSGT